jgi:cell wall-associated NlpC family hydrolase
MSFSPANVALALALLLGLGACASAPTSVPTGPVTSARADAGPAAARTPGERAAAIAREQVGAPYRYGGQSPAGFDCSGLVSFAWTRAGRPVPRTTGELWRDLEPVERASLEPGDVLFFDVSGKVSHVGLYLGDGRFVHAPETGRRVELGTLDSGYYRRAFVRGGRP